DDLVHVHDVRHEDVRVLQDRFQSPNAVVDPWAQRLRALPLLNLLARFGCVTLLIWLVLALLFG
ncbi:hypothetical protein PFISCL1PPCAC_21848, partial [Pristionchus fissidentatus]